MLPVLAPAATADGPDGSALVAACQANQGQAPLAGPQACRSLLAAEWGVAAGCRTPFREVEGADTPEKCAVVDGRAVSEAQVAGYEQGWTHRALSLQRELSSHLPLLDAPIVHTHNSFNSSAYRVPDPSDPAGGTYATVTNQDPNQAYSISDQLRMDVRAIEVDAHWVHSPWAAPNAATNGGYEVTSCHGKSQGGNPVTVHVGCSWDRPFASTLAELRAWLTAHPDQFVLVYLENQLEHSSAGHERAGQLIAEGLGNLVYRPEAGTPCAPTPTAVTAADVLATGHQVVLVGNCDGANGQATSWGTWVHARGPAWLEEGGPATYDDGECAADMARRTSATPAFRRYYEEVTWLGYMGDTAPQTAPAGHVQPIGVEAATRMAHCGVNLIGLDQLTPTDPRLAAQVWSWAPSEPAPGARCAYQGTDGRFHGTPVCQGVAEVRPYACLDRAGGWHVTAATGTWDDGSQVCATEFEGSAFDVPRSGWSNDALAAAKPSPGTEVWLGYRGVGADWVS